MTAAHPRHSPAELWCVHVLGPDDVIAAPDEAAAIRRAANMNKAIAGLVGGHGPVCVVEPWLWGAEAHAESLAKEPNWGELPEFIRQQSTAPGAAG